MQAQNGGQIGQLQVGGIGQGLLDLGLQLHLALGGAVGIILVRIVRNLLFFLLENFSLIVFAFLKMDFALCFKDLLQL